MNQAIKNRKRGKATEREIAKRMGGLRLGVLGADDVRIGDKYSVEVKSRVNFVGSKWMEQAIKNCPPPLIPIVRVHIYKKDYDKDLIIIRIKDFQQLK